MHEQILHEQDLQHAVKCGLLGVGTWGGTREEGSVEGERV